MIRSKMRQYFKWLPQSRLWRLVWFLVLFNVPLYMRSLSADRVQMFSQDAYERSGEAFTMVEKEECKKHKDFGVRAHLHMAKNLSTNNRRILN